MNISVNLIRKGWVDATRDDVTVHARGRAHLGDEYLDTQTLAQCDSDGGNAPAAIKEKLLSREKMSLFADRVFKRYADMQGCPVPLRKGAYYTLIDLLSPRDVPDEIRRRLDDIVERLSMPKRDEHEI